MSAHRGDGRPPGAVFRTINAPLPIVVETGADGEPLALIWRGRRLTVVAVADRWRVDDEWWRTPIARLYRLLVLADDRVLTVFEDLAGGGWYAQRYRTRRTGSGERGVSNE